MPDLALTIPPEQMKALLGEAILKSLDEPVRAALIADAISFLNAPRKNPNGYGPDRDPIIVEAFRNATEALARTEAHRVLSEDETYKAAVDALIRDALAKALSDGPPREAMVSKLASAIADAMYRDR